MANDVTTKEKDAPRFIRILVPAYLIGLLLIPLLWVRADWPTHVFAVPYAVAWAGALGASVQMANGVMRHGDGWSDAYDLWYVIGPFVGIATGVITYAILAAGIATLGSTRSGVIWGYVVAAFITGANYRQFNSLIQKAGTALFGTPGTLTS
jgi:hypothetical protein